LVPLVHYHQENATLGITLELQIVMVDGFSTQVEKHHLCYFAHQLSH